MVDLITLPVSVYVVCGVDDSVVGRGRFVDMRVN